MRCGGVLGVGGGLSWGVSSRLGLVTLRGGRDCVGCLRPDCVPLRPALLRGVVVVSASEPPTRHYVTYFTAMRADLVF